MKYDIESIKKRNKARNDFKKIIDIMLVIVMYNIVLIMVSCFNKIDNISILGYKSYIITTTSMEPTLNSGDVAIVKKVDNEELKVGDIITFYNEGKYVTHRITQIKTEDENTEYITKGDNNNLEDFESVKFEEISGKYVTKIPKFGNIIEFFENRLLFLVFVLICLILFFIKLNIQEKKLNRREKKNSEARKTFRD